MVDVARHARHISLPNVGVDGQRALTESSVLIIGAGGLGSPAALYLAAAGVGKLGLVDDDAVDLSNLQRQILHATTDVGQPKVESAKATLEALDPNVEVEIYHERLHPNNALDLFNGPEMMMQLREQAERFGLEVEDKNVDEVDLSERPYKVMVEGETFLTHSIIVCTGAESLWLDAPGEAEQKGRGISTCATCDGAFFRDEHVLVIGGGDSACEEATFLTRFASKVTLIHRRDVFKASTIMYERAANHPKIEIRTFRQIKEWLSDDKGLSGAVLENTQDGSTETIEATGAFIAIGHTPITDFLGNQVETDENGYIVHKEYTMTSVPGVFAAGDVVDTRYKQAITAAGMGCSAAMDVEKWLEENVH